MPRRPLGDDVVARRPLNARDASSVASVLADPAASYALQAVLRTWRTRDPVDAANDACVLASVLEAEARRRRGGRP